MVTIFVKAKGEKPHGDPKCPNHSISKASRGERRRTSLHQYWSAVNTISRRCSNRDTKEEGTKRDTAHPYYNTHKTVRGQREEIQVKERLKEAQVCGGYKKSGMAGNRIACCTDGITPGKGTSGAG